MMTRLLPLVLLTLTGCTNIIDRSTDSINCNSVAIQHSTEVIHRNAELIDHSNQVIAENQRLLEAMNKH